MTESTLPPAVQALIDRQEILDCELRYCSGVDRFDREMLLSAYHPGAIDDHGAFVGTAEEFVDWAFAYHRKYQHGHKHYILNHRCEFDGDTAHAETYWLFAGRNTFARPPVASRRPLFGPARKARRKWAIAARKCVIEWGGSLNDIEVPAEAAAVYALTGIASRDRMILRINAR